MTPVDLLVICGYLLLVLIVGLRASGRSESTPDLLLAGRSISTRAVLFSLLATELSAATFISVPQFAYQRHSWAYLQFGLGALLAKIVLSRSLIPLYHRLGVKTVYGLIAKSFGGGAQRSTAVAFVVGRILASGVRLYIAAIAFSAVTHFSTGTSILICTAIAGTYSLVGGIRSVIATDAVQAVVFIGGALAMIWVAVGMIPGGAAQFFDWSGQQDAMQIFFWSGTSTAEGVSFLPAWLSEAMIFPAALIGGFFLTMATHGTDHDMVQRLLSARDDRSAGRALVASGIINLPVTALFLMVGSAIACNWNLTPPDFAIDPDRVVPTFALQQLPSGLLGLVLAGLLAAAMSSLDSAICAISAAWTVDVLQRESRDSVKTMRIVSLVVTVLLAISAGGFALLMEKQWAAADDLISLALSSMTIIYGALLGVFLCAAFLPGRGSSGSSKVALLCGSSVGALLFLQKAIFGSVIIAWPWWIVITTPLTVLICSVQRRRSA